MNMRLQNYMAL